MPPLTIEKLTLIARRGLLAGGALFLLTYVVIACARLAYPFELEWLEEVMLGHAVRVRDGVAIYVPPSMEFVPLLYPPLYYVVTAVVSLVTGESFLTIRLVSFVSSLGVFAFVYRIVAHETTDRFAGIIALALFAATFAIGGGWFDVGRNDSLFLLFAVAAVDTLRRRETLPGAILAGALFALSTLTKQSALSIAAPLGLYLLLIDWRRGVAFGTAFGLLAGGTAWVWNTVSDGWFSYYVLEMPRHHELDTSAYAGFWTSDLLGQFPVATVIGLTFLATAIATRRTRSGFLLAFAGGCLATAWLSRVHTGGFENVLIPAYLALAVLLSVALHHVLNRGIGGRASPWFALGAYGAVGLQFLLLVYNPLSHLPDRTDRLAGERMIAEIGSLPGAVWVPGHSYLAERASKPSHAHTAMMHDVLRAGDSEAKRLLATELTQALEQQRYGALVMDWQFPATCPPRQLAIDGINWFCPEVHETYRLERKLLEPDEGFWPVTGSRRRPALLYRPRAAPVTTP